MKELRFIVINDNLIILFDNNKKSIALIKNSKHYQRTKYIDIKYYYIRQLIEDNNVSIDYISIDKITINILTKLLIMKIFQKNRRLFKIYDYLSKYIRFTSKRIQR